MAKLPASDRPRRRSRPRRGASARLVPALLGALLLPALPGETLPRASLVAGEALAYYLPEGVDYDSSTPTPSRVIGFEPGEWHARPDQIVTYFEALAAASERVEVSVYGYSHERRPLILATISSAENLARIDEIRARHVARATAGPTAADADADEDGSLADAPAIVWLGYSVHGNEPSGGNASLVLAYHLAAALDETTARTLDDVVVLVDPCINPDGFARFAQWANMHRGHRVVSDPRHREHVEPWPSGRTNHYWFDLNRDWLLLTHPESRARIDAFHAWRPNIVGDFHEMGTNSTFFFQPGVPSRQNPLTPPENLEITRAIARHHAEALDGRGSLYYTEETFDDFYYGKGSTYPDAHGAVGILFEQASSRGHVQENDDGSLSFPFTIRNQFTTSLSTLAAAVDERERLLEYQARFARESKARGERDATRAWLFGDREDRERSLAMADLLLRHRIRVHRLGVDLEADGRKFPKDHAFVVPASQAQHTLIRTLFERRTEFEDSTFYDVSTWTLPLAYAMPTVELGEEDGVAGLLGPELTLDEATRGPGGAVFDDERAYAYLFDWSPLGAPRALYTLLERGVRAKVAKLGFRATTSGGERDFRPGTIVVPAGIQQKLGPEELREALREAARAGSVDVWAVLSGYTFRGVDLGSPNVRAIEKPRPLLLVGAGVSVYEAGEVWHLLDRRLGVPVTLSECEDFGRLELGRYTHIFAVDGSYSPLGDGDWARLRDWVRAGGVLVAQRGGAKRAFEELLGSTAVDPAEEKGGAGTGAESSAEGGDAGEPKQDSAPESEPVRYADFEARRDRSRLSGAIFEARVDRTHPIGFGLPADALPVFRRGVDVFQEPRDPYSVVARYPEAPLLSGYASEKNVEKIASTPAVVATRLGGGTVVRIADVPAFRGYFRGAEKVLVNALFFGAVVKRTEPTE